MTALYNKAITLFLLSSCLLLVPAQQALSITEGEKPAHSSEGSSAANNRLSELKDETLSYFIHVSGMITSVEGNTVKIDAGASRGVKSGMRLQAFREGVNFIHPVTKEPLGRIETPLGILEVTSVSENSASGLIIAGESRDYAGARIKLPGTKVKLLFSQGNVDWVLGDIYYQSLKESGRFEMMDTGLDNGDTSKILAEARSRGSEAALVLSSEEKAGKVSLVQKLFWVNDARQFSEKAVPVEALRINEMKFKAGLFGPRSEEALLSFHLPFRARHIVVGDFDGSGNPSIILAADDRLRLYKPGVDLKVLEELKLPATDEILRLDTAYSNKNKRDTVLITAIQGREVTSYIYEVQSGILVQVWKAKGLFIRKLGAGNIAAQEYSRNDGYSGRVYTLVPADGAYKKGEDLKLPLNINIYDFQFVTSPDGKQGILAWDDRGYLNLYNDKGIRLWMSKEDFGGFSTAFKREAPTVMVDSGAWSVKDRLVFRRSEVLVPKRKPLVGMARGLGYKDSEIRSLWWNGIGVEEKSFIEKVGGELLDFEVTGDKIIVLSKVPFYTKATNIFKGESPFGVMLYFFSLKGR
jgi:hypothetical protein